MSFEAIMHAYERELRNGTDIWEHLPTLKDIASKCPNVVEFGVWDCTSTWGLLAGKPARMRSYDVIRRPEVDLVEAVTPDSGIDFKFIQQSSLEACIEPADFLFIDSLHTYDQLSQELDRHVDKISKFIGIHDTTTFGDVDEKGNRPGLWLAVEHFIAKNPAWIVKSRATNCNGLTILAKYFAGQEFY